MLFSLNVSKLLYSRLFSLTSDLSRLIESTDSIIYLNEQKVEEFLCLLVFV